MDAFDKIASDATAETMSSNDIKCFVKKLVQGNQAGIIPERLK